MCCQVEVSATSWSLVQRSSTDCDVSLCVIKKPQEWGGHGPHWAAAPQKTKTNSFLLEAESTPGPECSRKVYVNEKFQRPPSEIEPVSFHLVAQCLNQLCHCMLLEPTRSHLRVSSDLRWRRGRLHWDPKSLPSSGSPVSKQDSGQPHTQFRTHQSDVWAVKLLLRIMSHLHLLSREAHLTENEVCLLHGW